MITIIGIAGKARTGKSTFAEELSKVFSSMGMPHAVVPMADELKKIVPPEPGESKENWRPRLISMGNKLRVLHGEGHLAHRVRSLQPRGILIVPDVRIAAEADVLLSPNGLSVAPYLLRLSCPDEERAKNRFGPTTEQSVTAYWKYQKHSADDVTESGLAGYAHSRLIDVDTTTPESAAAAREKFLKDLFEEIKGAHLTGRI